MTVGQATVGPDKANPPHWHPNTDEILHVLQGRIMHRVGDRVYEMKAGDTVVIPEGVVHNARNIGEEDAILFVSFNSADRFTIGE
jgi:quercetin dioxygenase-like cupin family protein